MYLTQGLHRAVQQVPDAPATICGERVRTWRQHAGRVSRLAGALRWLGVRGGDRVGILARNSDRYAELLLAISWTGGVFTPVNIRWNPDEISYALRDSGTTVLCVDDASAGRVPALVEGHPGLKALIWLGDGPAPEGMSGYELVEKILRDQPRLPVLFTSGYPVDVGASGTPAAGHSFLQKPYDPVTLAQAVRDCLDGRPERESRGAPS